MPPPTSQFSASLDFLLCLVCLAIAIASVRARNDFLFSGFLWVAAAAFGGTFNLAGVTWTHETHTWLSQVARGPGMFALGLGVFAAVYGPLPGSRWTAHALAIAGAGMIYLLNHRAWKSSARCWDQRCWWRCSRWPSRRFANAACGRPARL